MIYRQMNPIHRTGKLYTLPLILLGLLIFVAVPNRQMAADSSAQNIIIFIGDGMGAEHVRAGGQFANGTAGTLSFESFAHATTSTHNNVSNQTTDSAAGATAIATGVKVANGVISQNSDGTPLTTLLELHKAEGKRTGLVTTSYMTDASPAAFGAHEPTRSNRTQIANDYFNGSKPNVLFGGGGDGFTTSAASSVGYGTITTRDQLSSINTEAQTLIAGVFGSGEIPPDGMSGRNSALPTLPEMTEAALNILDNGSDGLFLVVEHEGSDTYSHGNNAEGAVRSVAELSAAVQKAIDWKANNPNTIILVTADHETGGMTVNGNSSAGSIPPISWSTGGHTRVPVPVYADGVSAEQINGQQIDNTDIFDMLKPAATSGGSDGTVDVRVTNGSDDVEQRTTDGDMYSTSSDLELTEDQSYRQSNQVIGLRFQNVNVPQGATITDAYLQFVVDETQSESTSIKIYAHDTNNAAAFSTTNYDVSQRPKTSVNTEWNNIPTWTQGSTEQSPDISSVVQEVVNRGGWSGGNSMVFVITGSGRRTVESADSGQATAPLLHIEYSTGSTATITPTPTSTFTPTPMPDTPTPTATTVPSGSEANPWQTAAGSPTSVNVAWNYALGYHFTPLTDGNITALGGYFNGTKTVRLFNKATGALLAETTVTANNNWGYTTIAPIPVQENVQYTVAVYLAGSGASYQRNVNMPITSGNIQIDASTYASTTSNPNVRPTNSYTPHMYGQADIAFTASDGNIPPTNTPTPTPTPSPSVPNLNTYSATYAQNEDFGSSSTEFSAVTYNHSNGDIVIVEDNDSLFRYSTNGNNAMIPVESSRETMNVTVGSGDTEGVAWMYGTTYAILSENNGQIHIVDLNNYSDGDNISSASHTISTGIPETSGAGAEGVAFKFGSATSAANQTSAIFYVVKEKTNRVLYEVNWNGLTGRQITINGLNDLSDVYYGATNGEMYIISHESQQVVQLGEIDWNASSISATGKPSISISSYSQAEGLAFNADQSVMVIVSEIGNLTYGRFTAP